MSHFRSKIRHEISYSPFFKVKVFSTLIETIEYLENVVSKIRVAEVRVRRFADRIFFCGGPTKASTSIDDDFFSARDVLLFKWLATESNLHSRLFIEKQMSEWSKDGHYTDLLSLERHIAKICKLVFLIAESPGAYAEIGVFVTEPDIVKKILVLISEGYDNDSTFLSLGPIKYLKEKNEGSVIVYPWSSWYNSSSGPKIQVSDFDDISRDIASDVKEYEKSILGTELFDVGNEGHIGLFILEMLYRFGCLLQKEILVCIKKIDTAADLDLVRRHLYVLEMLGLVERRSLGSTYFFNVENGSYLNLSFEKGVSTDVSDQMRFKITLRNWYETRDPKRLKLIRKHISGFGS